MKQFIIILTITTFISVNIFGQSSTKFILLEEFSTAPCGFCPDGDIIAAQLVKDHPQVIWVTHHAGFGTDSMTVNESKAIASTFTTFAPGACIDRMDVPIPVYTKPPYIAISRQKWDSVSTAHLADAPVARISIENKYDKSTRNLNCKVTTYFYSVPASGDIRLNIFLVEDSVVGYGHGYDQKSYFNKTSGHPLYGKGDTIIGYVHHHVIRAIPTRAWGISGIIPNSPEAGKSYSYSIDIPVSVGWKENDMDVVAFAGYFNTEPKQREVINSNHRMLLDETTNNGDIINPDMVVYPNPVQDLFYIEGDISNLTSLRIINLHGEVVKNIQGNKQYVFSVSDLADGIYFYQLFSGKELTKTAKMVVIH